MTTRPSVDQARAYADALVAWAEGKRVEYCVSPRSRHADLARWREFDGSAFEPESQYRIAPAPPKLREFWLSSFDMAKRHTGAHGEKSIDVYVKNPVERHPEYFIHVREVSETADAEMAELRRNHDALAKLADEIISVGREGCLNFWDESHVRAVLNKHGAILK